MAIIMPQVYSWSLFCQFPFKLEIQECVQDYKFNKCYNIYRQEATTNTYTVPHHTSSTAGSYTCSVTLSNILSSESDPVNLSATG